MERISCYLLAMLAGASGLMAQVVWARLFGSVFGVTQAAAVVLATVLAGLAVGALYFGRRADRSANPLRLALLLVAAQGTVAVIGAWLLVPGTAAVDEIAAVAIGVPAVQVLAGILLALLVVLPSNVLLGGVVPALTRVGIVSDAQLRPRISLLYSLETCGGAMGAMLAGFWLIQTSGLHVTLWLTAAVCILVTGAVALVNARGARSQPAKPAVVKQEPLTDDGIEKFAAGDRLLLLTAGLVGFAALGMEVIWTRLLLLLAGSDSYAYASVVASFLLGIALGALLARPITPRLRAPLRMLVWLQLTSAVATLALLAVFQWLATGPGQRWLAALEGSGATALGGRFLLFIGLLLVPATLLGLSFPVAASHLVRHVPNAARRTGQLFAASAVGNVMGALTTGFLLLPLVGLQRGVVALAMVNVAAGAAALIAWRRHRRAAVEPSSNRWPWSAAVQGALVIALLAGCTGWWWLRSSRTLAFDAADANWRDYELTFYREGPIATVMVLRDRTDTQRRMMAVDGVIIGESAEGAVDEKQRLLAHLPFLLRPDVENRRILTIGLGTGILAGELLRQSDDARIVCVEISPEVVEAARQFDDLNGSVLHSPRATILVGDGIHFVRQSRETFDAIVSDGKSKPGHVGNAAFFSAEYYQRCQERLAPDGVLAQWVSLETPPEALRIMLRTFAEAFPQGYLGIAAPDSLYLVGAKRPLTLDVARMQRQLESPAAESLRVYGWSDACDIVALLAADSAALRQWLGNGTAVNTLERPVLEAEALEVWRMPVEERRSRNLSSLARLFELPAPRLNISGGDAALLANCRQSARFVLDASLDTLARRDGWFEQAVSSFAQARELAPRCGRLRLMAGELCREQADGAEQAGDMPRAIDAYRQAVAFQPRDAAARRRLIVLLRQAGLAFEATQQCYDALQLDPANNTLRMEFAFSLLTVDKPTQAAEQFRLVLENDPRHARAHLGLGLVLLSLNDYLQATQHLRRAVELDASLRGEVESLGIDADT